jgi:hypothetical protein
MNSGTSEEEDPESQRSDSDEEISGPQVDCVTTAETTDDAVEEKNDTDEDEHINQIGVIELSG